MCPKYLAVGYTVPVFSIINSPTLVSLKKDKLLLLKSVTVCVCSSTIYTDHFCLIGKGIALIPACIVLNGLPLSFIKPSVSEPLS